MRKAVICLAFSFLLGLQPVVRGQDEEKIRKLFEDAIQAMGGDSFLKVADIVSEGNYFAFDRSGNLASGLVKFNDYTKLPDKSRFELGNKKKERDVTVFNLEKKEGWILEGQKETREASEEEMKSFQDAVKHSLETIFRYRYKDPENKLFYLGVADDNVQLEMVKIIDPENDDVTVYFDRMSKLPLKVEYQVMDARGIRRRETAEYSQWHVIDGVNTPLRVDTYWAGRTVSQLYIVKLTYNNNLTDDFFSKPVPPK